MTWRSSQPPQLVDPPWVVTFLSADTGFVGGYNGMLLRTTNGGTTWASVNNGGYSGNFNDIQFATRLVGWGCGTNGNGTVIQTTDGGLNWTIVNLGNTTTRYSILPFSVSEILIGGGSGNLPRTTDGGTTWTSSTQGTAVLYNMARMGQNGVVIAGSVRTLLRSTDRGATFSPVLVQGGAGTTLYGVAMADSLKGFAVGSNGQNFRTTNAWATIDSILPGSFTAQVCRTLFVKSSSEIFVGADQGNIMRSTDFGNSWHTVESSTTYYALDFADANNGVAVGWRGTIIATSNGGTTWREIKGVQGFELYSVKMFDAQTFYAGGGSGRFYVTTDGRSTFPTRSLPYTRGDVVKTLNFFNRNQGYAAGENGSLYYTTNAGTSWTAQYSFGTSFNDVEGITFLNDTVAFAVGEGGRVARTTNRSTWDTTGIVRQTL